MRQPYYRYKILHPIQRGYFKEALEVLRQSEKAGDLSSTDKIILIEEVDRFLEEMESFGRNFQESEIQTLFEIKKILIVYQLEASDYDRIRLRDLLKAALLGFHPLSNLVRKPFAFCMDNIQVDPDRVLDLYREILKGMSPTRAQIVHQAQTMFYRRLPPTRAYVKRTLLKFMEV